MADSYYEELGVARDATAEQVQRAYRRKASATHPDREGGDADAFKRAGEAYEVLRDPAKRAAYDQHGKAGGQPDFMAQIDTLLEQLFEKALENDGNVVEIVQRVLAMNASELPIKRSEKQMARDALARRLPKVTTKNDTPNVFERLVNRKIATLDAELKVLDDSIAMVEAATVRLADYVDTTKARPRPEETMESALFAALGQMGGRHHWRFRG